MRLSTRIHGFLDYGLGLVLLLLPWLMGVGIAAAAGAVPAAIGVALILNAAATDFEAGRWRRVQLPLHLWIDGLLGLLLALSPWFLDFDRTAWVPHAAIGVALMAAAFVTHTKPGYDRRRSGAPPTAP